MASLFAGSPQAAPSYAATTSDVPKWLQDYTVDLFSQQRAVAATPYQPYALPRIAQTTAPTTAAQNLITSSSGAYQPAMQNAISGTQALAGQGAGTTAGLGYLQQAAGMSGSAAAAPLFNQATNMATQAGGINTATPLNMTQGQYTNAALAGQDLSLGQSALAQSGQQNVMGAASPYLTQAGSLNAVGAANPYITQGAGQNIAGAASPYINRALGQDIMGAANPYLQSAGQSSVNNISSYMNPYTQNVTDQIASLGARNLSENLLPAVSDQFIRAGQFGSSGMGTFGGRALRDTQEAILNQQNQALQAGYVQALGASQADLARQGQLASTAGQLTGQQAQNYLTAGQTQGQLAGQQAQNLLSSGQALGQLTTAQQQGLSNLGQTAGQLTGTQAQNLANLGQTYTQAGQAQQATGIGAAQVVAQQQALDATRQMAAAQELGTIGQQTGALTQAGQQNLGTIGAQTAATAQAEAQRQAAAQQQVADLAKMRQGLTTADAATLESVGTAQQQQQQRGLDVAYQDYQNQIQYPQTQINNMSTTLRGLPPSAVPTTGTTSGYSTTFAPSPLSDIASAYGVYKGLTKAKGGLIQGYAAGGSVSGGDDLHASVMADYGQYFNQGGEAQGYAFGGKATATATAQPGSTSIYNKTIPELQAYIANLTATAPSSGGMFGKLMNVGMLKMAQQELDNRLAAGAPTSTADHYTQTTSAVPTPTVATPVPVVMPANIDELNAKYYQNGSPWGNSMATMATMAKMSHGGRVPGYAEEGYVDTENPADLVAPTYSSPPQRQIEPSGGGYAPPPQTAAGQLAGINPELAALMEAYNVDNVDYSADLSANRKAIATERAAYKTALDNMSNAGVATGPSESEKWLNFAAAFADPGKTGSFGEGMGHAASSLAANAAEQRKANAANAANAAMYGLKQHELTLESLRDEAKNIQGLQTDQNKDKRELIKEYIKGEIANGKVPDKRVLWQLYVEDEKAAGRVPLGYNDFENQQWKATNKLNQAIEARKIEEDRIKNRNPWDPVPMPTSVTMEDVKHTSESSGKSIEQVKADFKAAGVTIK